MSPPRTHDQWISAESNLHHMLTTYASDARSQSHLSQPNSAYCPDNWFTSSIINPNDPNSPHLKQKKRACTSDIYTYIYLSLSHFWSMNAWANTCHHLWHLEHATALLGPIQYPGHHPNHPLPLH
jgi:hypothetical protein